MIPSECREFAVQALAIEMKELDEPTVRRQHTEWLGDLSGMINDLNTSAEQPTLHDMLRGPDGKPLPRD